MEVSTLKNVGMPGMRGPSPFLRLQADERLVELTRRGNQAAYEVLVSRYNSRLVAFTRHMLGSKEDVEDVFEVLAKKDVREPTNWSRRFKNHQEKLKSGDVYQVAEVVRNLALREKAKGLSAGEKNMYTKARKVLVSELSFALDVSEEAAMDQVEEQLI